MQARHRCLRAVAATAVAAFFTIGAPDTSLAESSPALPGFTSLGQVVLDKSGCASCPAVFATGTRHRAFAFASDSPYPVSLTGRIEVTCANGWSYHVLLQSPLRSGLFQMVPNSCLERDAKEVTLAITSAGLSPRDAERKVALHVYASFA